MRLTVSLFFALIITVLFILVLRPVALEIGLVDIPGGRKKHKHSTPVIGGIAMYIGFVFGSVFMEHLSTFSPLIMGGALLIVVGAIDDRFSLTPAVRLITQTCAALIMIYVADMRIDTIGAPLFVPWELGAIAIPFTILVTLTVINAFNIIDGIDGLSGGVAFIVLGFMAILSMGGSTLILALLLMAVITGFLICNAPIHFDRQAKCFMGDSGSTFLGFSVVYLGIFLSQVESDLMSPVTGLWLVAVPIYDVVTSVFRRIIRKQSPFKPDRYHLHHILIDGGLSTKAALLAILLFTFIAATVGLIGEIFIVQDSIMFFLWCSLGVFYYVHIVFLKAQVLIALINKHQSKLMFIKQSNVK